MHNKILIGSIIAICILIGVSFTSVVGYSSNESNVKESPLFNIRSSRAIDEESEDITYDYIRKGNTFPIPIRNSTFELSYVQYDVPDWTPTEY